VSQRRVLDVVFFTAVAVSIVHYTDNYLGYDSYPHKSGPIPDPSATTIVVAWFAFTALGVAGYLLYRQGRTRPAVLLLAAYSGSGLIGIGHYTVPGMTDAVWWRQAHVIADILLGIAMLTVAVWIALANDRLLNSRDDQEFQSPAGP
jgi:hypothetical protein